MQIVQARSLCTSATHCLFPISCLHSSVSSRTINSGNVLRLCGAIKLSFKRLRKFGALNSSPPWVNPSSSVERKRKVVEHICLLKAKKDLSDEEEKDMLDYLYTSQYQMGGIVAISLGRNLDENREGYTHAVFMRFQKEDDLAKFYENQFYLKILKEHVTLYCHGLMNVDFVSEVEDDMLPIFRKGEEFNYGVELVLLFAFPEHVIGGLAEDALSSLASMIMEFPSLIVQSTQGSNFNLSSKEYTHAMLIRFRSSEAFQIFMSSSEYINLWRSKFEAVTLRTLSIHYSVDPVVLNPTLIGFVKTSCSALFGGSSKAECMAWMTSTGTVVP